MRSSKELVNAREDLKRSLVWGLALLLFSSFGGEAVAQTCVEPSPDIVAWWPFDEASGTTAADIAGGHDGVHINGPAPSPGMVDGALRFNGINQFVGAGDSDDWAFGTNDFTIEFWANFDVPGHGSIFHAGDVFIGNDEGPGFQNKWFFALGAGVLHFTVYNTLSPPPNFFLARAPFSPIVGQWYHLAVTKRGTLFTIYVNGAPTGTEISTSPIANPNAPLIIGQSNEPFGGFMNGFLDEITVYGRALTQNQLQEIAQAGTAGKCKGVVIKTQAVSALQLSVEFSQQLAATSGVPPYFWSDVAGTLPPGMSLDSDGLFSGIPTELGNFTFTVRVTDDSGDTDELEYSVDVALVLPPPDIRLHKTGGVAVPGRTFYQFIVVENVGTVAASDKQVLDFLDPTFEFLFADPPAETDGATLGDSTAVLWPIPSIAPGESAILLNQVRIDASTPLAQDVGKPACNVEQLDELAACLGLTSEVCAASGPVCVGLCAAAPFACTVTPFSCANYIKNCASCVVLACFLGPGQCFANANCSIPEIPTTGPEDPNEKLVVAETFIQPDQLLVYPIIFENKGPVEARDVFVTDVLHINLDDSTLELLTPGGSYDPATRTVRFDLLGINVPPAPAPGEQGGTGNVLFSIRPVAGLPSGTEIRNRAEIQFEVFAPLVTADVVNIIDTTEPRCLMDELPGQVFTEEFEIFWSGSDAVGEIDSFSVFGSEDGGPFEFVLETSATSTTFVGASGRSYGFFCVAKDTVGNVEEQNFAPETTTIVTPVQAVVIDIKPGSGPSSWDCRDIFRDLPVAVLSDAGFDATTVDADSVSFGKTGTEAVEAHRKNSAAKRHVEDVNKDGLPDMVFHFLFLTTGFSCNDIPAGQNSAVLPAKLTGVADGKPIEGEDALRLVNQ